MSVFFLLWSICFVLTDVEPTKSIADEFSLAHIVHVVVDLETPNAANKSAGHRRPVTDFGVVDVATEEEVFVEINSREFSLTKQKTDLSILYRQTFV